MKFQALAFALVLTPALPAVAFMSDNIASPTGAACEQKAGGKVVAQAKDADWAAKGITNNDICCINDACLNGWTVFRLLKNGTQDEQIAITAYYSSDRSEGKTGEQLCEQVKGTVKPEVDIIGTNPLVTKSNPECVFQDQSGISIKTLLQGPKNPANKAFNDFIEKTRGPETTTGLESVSVHIHNRGVPAAPSTTSRGGGFQ